MTKLVWNRRRPGRPYSGHRLYGLVIGVHMPVLTSHRRAVALAMPALLALLALTVTMVRTPAGTSAGMRPAAVAAMTVAQAISSQSGPGTVSGYVVGQPTATNTVLFANFTGDTALAIADSSTETDTGDMLYVQITSAYRASFGLQSNPSLIGDALTVTGTLGAYFTHPGLKSPSAMTLGGATTPTPTPTATGTATPTPTTSNSTGTYYAAAAGKSGESLKTALHGIIASGA